LMWANFNCGKSNYPRSERHSSNLTRRDYAPA